MYLFIAIIFIAELIIASSLICSFDKLDRKVLAFNNQVCEFHPKLEKTLTNLKNEVKDFAKRI